jgi:hypothetical protein
VQSVHHLQIAGRGLANLFFIFLITAYGSDSYEQDEVSNTTGNKEIYEFMLFGSIASVPSCAASYSLREPSVIGALATRWIIEQRQALPKVA